MRWKLALFVVLCLLVSEAAAKSKTSRYDRVWRQRKRQCEQHGACRGIDQDEHPNCVPRCTSEACYRTVYAADPLEPGEVDFVRARQFTACLRDEVREELRAVSAR